MRAIAATALAQLGSPCALQALQTAVSASRVPVEALIEVLATRASESEELARAGAARALVAIGPPAVAPLVRELDRRCFPTAAATESFDRLLVWILGEIGDPDAAEVIVRRCELGKAGAELRSSARQAYRSIGQRYGVSLLLEGPAGWRTWVDWDVVREFGDPAVDPLVRLLHRAPSLSKRSAALRVLESIGWVPREQADKAARAVSLHDWDTAESAGRAAVEVLLPLLEADSWHLVRVVADALGRIGDARSAEPLANILQTPKTYPSAAYESRYGADLRMDPFYEWADPAHRLRIAQDHAERAVMRALARIPDPRATALLIDAFRLHSSDMKQYGFRIHLRAALELVPAEYAVPAIQDVFVRKEKYAWLWQSHDPDLEALAQILGRCDDQSVVDPLLSALECSLFDPVYPAEFAGQALAQLGCARAAAPLLRRLKWELGSPEPWRVAFKTYHDALQAILGRSAAAVSTEILVEITCLEDFSVQWVPSLDWGVNWCNFDFSALRRLAGDELAHRGVPQRSC